jgi:hypothetical protein
MPDHEPSRGKGEDMKKILLVAIAALGLAACEVNTTGNIDFDANDVGYFKDNRTGLCFAAVASRKSFDANASGFGLTNVPCSDAVVALAR